MMVRWVVLSREGGICEPVNCPMREELCCGPALTSRKSWLSSEEKFWNWICAPGKWSHVTDTVKSHLHMWQFRTTSIILGDTTEKMLRFLSFLSKSWSNLTNSNVAFFFSCCWCCFPWQQLLSYFMCLKLVFVSCSQPGDVLCRGP